jgi:hypothetical protein
MRTRSELMEQLATTKRQVLHGENVIYAQRLVVATLSARGHDATQAEQILDTFEQSQEIRLGEMDRLLNALDKY